MRTHISSLFISAFLLLTGCASISVQHLDPTGATSEGAPGIRYYLPRPYLLVTLLPADSTSANGATTVETQTPPVIPPTQPAHPAPAAPARPAIHRNPAPSGGGQNPGQPSGSDGSQTTAPTMAASGSPTTDTSFSASTSQYSIKLVYLPDLHNPMALTMSAGLFGSMSAQPTLQDGWMLTSLQGSADNSQVMSAAISALASGASKSGTTGKAPNPSGGNGAAVPNSSVLTDQMLAPGLYSFQYDESSGELKGLCLMTSFGSSHGKTVVPPCAPVSDPQ